MTTIYFIRHCKPDLSIKEDHLRPLSPEGVRDSQTLVTLFQDTKIDTILSSPYKRAYETVAPLAIARALPIVTNEDFRERKVSDQWLSDFQTFAYRQWHDFSYKLTNGESLEDVQSRNIKGLTETLTCYNNQSIVIGTHGTALSTIINYYDSSFRFSQFDAIKAVMPWVVKMTFEQEKCLRIEYLDQTTMMPTTKKFIR